MTRAALFVAVVAGHSFWPVWDTSWTHEQMERAIYQYEQARGYSMRSERVPKIKSICALRDTLWGTDGQFLYWASLAGNRDPGWWGPAPREATWHVVPCVVEVPR